MVDEIEQEPASKTVGANDRRDDRARRQAEALRANLWRRKIAPPDQPAPPAPLPPQTDG